MPPPTVSLPNTPVPPRNSGPFRLFPVPGGVRLFPRPSCLNSPRFTRIEDPPSSKFSLPRGPCYAVWSPAFSPSVVVPTVWVIFVNKLVSSANRPSRPSLRVRIVPSGHRYLRVEPALRRASREGERGYNCLTVLINEFVSRNPVVVSCRY